MWGSMKLRASRITSMHNENVLTFMPPDGGRVKLVPDAALMHVRTVT